MSRIISVLFIILCLLSVPFLKNYTTVVKANDDVTIWHVPGNFTKIQDAIYSPLVQDGDIIFVHEGIYNETIVVNRTLSLIGENKHTTIVDGGARGNVVSIVGAINVVLERFTIRNGGSYSGILVDHSMNIEISNNIVMNNQEGIRLYVSAGCIISDNSILNNNDGVSFSYSSDNTISNNTIQSNTFYGINLYSSRKNLIAHNFILYNGLSGVYMLFANDNVICGNTINSNDPYANGINLYLID
ncbi:MAG: NosD domain-containing protein, partial [Candidatus Bathyarchaeia archaeon]